MSHPSREQWIDYFAGDSAEEEALDGHLLACQRCSEVAAGVAALTGALREMIPPLLSLDALSRLRTRGVRVREHPLLPGGPHEAIFPQDADVLLFRLAGLDLTRATAVELSLRVETGGEVLMTERAPFDPAGGEVLLACQRHFAALPPNIIAEVRARDDDGRESVTRYTIHHHFPAPPR